MKKLIPTIQFKIADLDSRLKLMEMFINEPPKKNFQKRIFKEYPKLELKLKNIISKQERKKISNKFFRHLQKEIKGKTTKSLNNFQKTWNFMAENSLETISEIIELEWPKSMEKFKVNVSFNPVCPRFLKDKEFDIFYKSNMKEMKETIFHELIHFLYFEKWKKIFPKTPEKNFESPNLEWEMSEMVMKTILGDKRIQKITTFKPQIYPEYEKIIIGNNFLLNHINKFYKNKTSFENFLKKTWEFIQKNEKKIQNQLKQ